MDLLNEIEARLKSIDQDVIYRTDAVLSLDTAMDQSRQSGVYAYIVPLAERPNPSDIMSGPVRQLVVDVFGVLFVVNTPNDTQGKRSLEKLTTARKEVRELLQGWQPDSATAPCERVASDIMKMQKSQVFWLDRYTTQHIETAII
jgi:hypothetical protein